MILADLINLFYPKTCLHCGNQLHKHEDYLCMFCHSQLAFTTYTDWAGNPLEKALAGRIPVEQGTALLFFRKQGITQHLIHLLKYKGEETIGTFLGHMLGELMAKSERFKDLDGIIKVPLHPKKLKKRGYNQLTLFAQSLASHLDIPVLEHVLVKVKTSETQTRKNRLNRFKEFNEKFRLIDGDAIEGKHILLVDDVITTGATLEACSNELLKAHNTKISIATMAVPE